MLVVLHHYLSRWRGQSHTQPESSTQSQIKPLFQGLCMWSSGAEKSQDVSARERWWLSGQPHWDTHKRLAQRNCTWVPQTPVNELSEAQLLSRVTQLSLRYSWMLENALKGKGTCRCFWFSCDWSTVSIFVALLRAFLCSPSKKKKKS